MGVILSAIALVTNPIKKSRDRRKAKKIREAYGPQETTASQPFSHSQTYGAAVEGLRDDHLASVPPAGIGQHLDAGEARQVERIIAVEAPLPLTATS